MTLATHTAIGTGIGFFVANPILGFILGFISHFAVDMIPHGDSALADQMRKEKKVKLPVALISLDAIVAMFLILLAFNLDGRISNVALSAAIAGSVLPDLLVGIHDVTKTKYLRWFNRMHFFFHDFFIIRYRDVKLQHSLALQIGFMVLLFNLI